MLLLDWLCPPALAHGFAAVPVDDVPASIWWEWKLEWLPLVVILALFFVYFRAAYQARVKPSEHVLTRGQAVRFVLGWSIIYTGIASPIDTIGEQYLFTMHMFQHNLFMYLAPRLILSGVPGWMLEPVLERYPLMQSALRFATHPIVACLAFNMVFTLWHIPFLYDWALRDRMVHNLEHVTFISTALLMWIPIMSPVKDHQLSYPKQMLYLLSLTVAQIPVFAYVTFSSYVLYPTYELAPRLIGVSALGDQQMGGVLMKLVSMGVFSFVFIGVFTKWYRSERQKESVSAPGLPDSQPITVKI
jgi:putative membrane protein